MIQWYKIIFNPERSSIKIQILQTGLSISYDTNGENLSRNLDIIFIVGDHLIQVWTLMFLSSDKSLGAFDWGFFNLDFLTKLQRMILHLDLLTESFFVWQNLSLDFVFNNWIKQILDVPVEHTWCT